MKLSLKTAVFTRCLGENTVAWTISRRGHQYGVLERRGTQYGEWDGRINQNVVVNLHRGPVMGHNGLRRTPPNLAIKTQITSFSVRSTVLNKPGNCLLSCHVYLINMR